jgi:hypothetical protein
VEDQYGSERLGAAEDSVIIYPVTPILSVAVKVVTGTVKLAEVDGMVKAETTGLVVSVQEFMVQVEEQAAGQAPLLVPLSQASPDSTDPLPQTGEAPPDKGPM